MTTVFARSFARAAALFAAALLYAMPAQAEWHRAESERFIIYSDSRADDLEEFAETLERYHVALSLETGRQVPVPSPSSRLTIYMVGSGDDLRRLYGNRRSSVGGFYIPRANGSVAFVPNIRIGGGGSRARGGTRYRRQIGDEVDESLRVLLHEYAHHFLIGSARHAMPRWLSEGSAEYFSSARFNDDGSVDIGLPNNSRAWEISQAAPVSLAELLDYELYRENRGARYDAYYGRAWLLYHYLRFEPSRAGQLPAYWQAVAQGAGSTEAARAIFGDLGRLEKELKQYANQRRMAGMRFAASDIRIGSVKVERLSEGHAAMMDVILRSKRGVDEELAARVVADARAIAARYPDDGEVQAALAEAEYDAGNDDAAIAAADRAIGADPTVTNAYVQKGYALFRKAEQADDADAAYAAAMAPFEALNALETDHTQPLIYYYRSFTRRGITPTEDARFAIERATQLAPFDKNLALEVAVMKAGEGQSTIARYLLAPVAADPHGGSRAATARDMIAFLETVPDGRRVAFKDLEVGGDKEGDADEGGDEGEEGES
jgi:Flp pilus assembly protein TadD